MSMHERVLNLLAMKLVDDIVFDAPFTVSKEMINHMNIDEGEEEANSSGRNQEGGRYHELLRSRRL